MAKEWATAFYHSEMWRNVRREALSRDNYTCTTCYDRASEVHHIIELTPGNINDARVALNLDNLESLCHNCHTKETKGCSGDVVGNYLFDDDGRVIPAYPPGGTV